MTDSQDNEGEEVLIGIPEDVAFSDLKLARDKDGMIRFDWTPIERICEASGINLSVFTDYVEDNVSRFIVQWYTVHRQHGGDADPVAESLMEEARFDQESEELTSHKGGHA